MAKKVTALAQWYGGDRMICPEIAKLLDGCEWVGIPFAGGMSAIQAIRARTIVANDLHQGIIALAETVANKSGCELLQENLRKLLFHPTSLERAQDRLGNPLIRHDRYQDAFDYFVVCWMTRSGVAGTDAEQTAGLSIRWEAGGGDSAKRFYSAIDSLTQWCAEFQRCTFQCLDAFAFIDKCQDKPKHGIYVDPPFVEVGKKYTHKFSVADWQQLARQLAEYQNAVVVVRCYDHPVMRELFPVNVWQWHHIPGRTQTNSLAQEVLITNKRSNFGG